MSSLLTLPQEVRDQIYEYCLSISEALTPYGLPYMHATTQTRLTLSLLSVSKIVREECLPILFGKNTWILPGNPEIIRTRTIRTIFHNYGHLFHSVLLIFRHFHLHGPDDSTPAVPLDAFEGLDRRLNLKLMTREWEAKDLFLAMMPNLRLLHINLTAEICPPKCILRKAILHEVFGKMLQTLIEKEVDVSLVGAREDEVEIVRQWRNKGLKEGDEGSFRVDE